MVHIVIGTNVQFAKLAPIVARLHYRDVPNNFVFGGKHRQTPGDMLSLMGSRPIEAFRYE
jgi:UDP-N-acetylglucosamine 2-epimerase